jgi:hypothetical protein
MPFDQQKTNEDPQLDAQQQSTEQADQKRADSDPDVETPGQRPGVEADVRYVPTVHMAGFAPGRYALEDAAASIDLDGQSHSGTEVTAHVTVVDTDGTVLNRWDHAVAPDKANHWRTMVFLALNNICRTAGKFEIHYWATNMFGSSAIQSVAFELVDEKRQTPLPKRLSVGDNAGDGSDGAA